MNDYKSLAARLDNLARQRVIDGRSVGGSDETNLMLREAAIAIRAQADRIKELEEHISMHIMMKEHATRA